MSQSVRQSVRSPGRLVESRAAVRRLLLACLIVLVTVALLAIG